MEDIFKCPECGRESERDEKYLSFKSLQELICIISGEFREIEDLCAGCNHFVYKNNENRYELMSEEERQKYNQETNFGCW